MEFLVGLLGSLAETLISKYMSKPKQKEEAMTWVRLASELSVVVPTIVKEHGTDVKFRDIDFQKLKLPGWDTL